MILDKVVVIFVAIILILALCVRYIKRYAPENLVIISFASFCTSIYIILTINDIYIPNYLQIAIFVFSLIIPLIAVSLQYNNIVVSRKILYYNMKVAFISRDYKKTISIIEKIVNLQGRNNEIMYTLGLCYKNLNDYMNARDSFIVAIEMNDKDYKSYYELGLILDETNKKDKAAEMYKKAIELNPNFYEAEEALGISYTSQGKYKDAIKIYKDAVKRHPNSYELYYNIGMIEMELKNEESAESAFRKAGEIKPDLFTAHYNVGVLNMHHSKYEEAIADFKKILNSNIYGPKGYFKIAICYAALKEYEKSMSSLEYAIELDKVYIEKSKNEHVFESMRKNINTYLEDRQILKAKEKQSKNYMKD